MLTVYGIETKNSLTSFRTKKYKLQQHLPFTVLKLFNRWVEEYITFVVATALTVYGIETT